MTYPHTAGFQSHSETSREAAAKLDASTLRGKVLERLVDYRTGLTADDLSIIFDTPCSTIAARLRELELAGNVIKTKEKRLTRHKRNAFVYVHVHNWHPNMGRSCVKNAPPSDIVKLEAEHGRMASAIYSARKDLKVALEQHDAVHFEKCIRSALHKLNEAAKEKPHSA